MEMKSREFQQKKGEQPKKDAIPGYRFRETKNFQMRYRARLRKS